MRPKNVLFDGFAVLNQVVPGEAIAFVAVSPATAAAVSNEKEKEVSIVDELKREIWDN